MAEGWSPETDGLRVEVVDDVGVIRLSRPKLLNALDLPTLRDLTGAISWYGTEGRASGLVLIGEGKVFSAGADLPVIGGVNGIAVGGGAEIACACDLRVGCPESDFMFPENFLGLTITNGSSLTPPRLVGRRGLTLILLR